MDEQDAKSLRFFFFMVGLLLISIVAGITAADLSEENRLAEMCGPKGYPIERIIPNTNPVISYWECTLRP